MKRTHLLVFLCLGIPLIMAPEPIPLMAPGPIPLPTTFLPIWRVVHQKHLGYLKGLKAQTENFLDVENNIFLQLCQENGDNAANLARCQQKILRLKKLLKETDCTIRAWEKQKPQLTEEEEEAINHSRKRSRVRSRYR